MGMDIEPADQKELLTFYTDVLRGIAEGPSGQPPTLGDRLKAADALGKRLSSGREMDDALARLDAILEAIRSAAER